MEIPRMSVVQQPTGDPVAVSQPECGPYIPSTGQPAGWSLIGCDEPAETREIIRRENITENVMEYERKDYSKLPPKTQLILRRKEYEAQGVMEYDNNDIP